MESDLAKRVTCWSASVIWFGLLLIAGQLAAQLYTDHEVAVAAKATPSRTVLAASSYIGLTVFLTGAVLMALVILASRRRADPSTILERRVRDLETAANKSRTEIDGLNVAATDCERRIQELERTLTASGVAIVTIEAK